MLQPLLAIAFVFALLAAAVWRFGKVGSVRIWGPAKDAQLASAARLRLTPQHSVHIVSTGGRKWLVACHSSGVTLLAELNAFDRGMEIVARQGGVSA